MNARDVLARAIEPIAFANSTYLTQASRQEAERKATVCLATLAAAAGFAVVPMAEPR